jgi:hypothetical protein
MKPIRIAAVLALLAAAAPAPAAAETLVPLARFNAIELRGGGQVRLRYGPVQRVTLVRGSTAHSSIAVKADDRRKPDRLVIEACARNCPRVYKLEIEIETPDLQALSVEGGGAIDAETAFPAMDSIAVAVHGGGQIDVRKIGAASVAAAVDGGGVILTRPESSLAAAISGGGEIRYWGNPSVSSSINGGGSVLRGATR